MSQALTWDHVDRHRLVRLCALVSGSWVAAEDLAQDTLLEAHRNAAKLTDPRGAQKWLDAVARNVCRRWLRQQGVAAARRADPTDTLDEVEDDFDLERELERDELARLLDRALALLPEQSRDVLVHRFVDESTTTAIAERLGISPAAVSMRIGRGKLMLRRVLETELRADAEAYGFLRPYDGNWRATSVWCTQCGDGRLWMSTSPYDGSLSFRCTTCFPQAPMVSSYYAMSNPQLARLLGPVARPTAIVGRAATWVHDYFGGGVQAGSARCSRCGDPTPLRRYTRPEGPYPRSTRRGVYLRCDRCGEEVSCSLPSLALALPQVRSFRRRHPRLRSLPERTVEHAGRPALVLGFCDVAERARAEVILDEETLAVRRVCVPAR